MQSLRNIMGGTKYPPLGRYSLWGSLKWKFLFCEVINQAKKGNYIYWNHLNDGT